MRNYIEATANFSDCKKYRYNLFRMWTRSKPAVMFIGLNPSTANHQTDDATIKSAVRIAKKLGYGAMYMVNLFPFISTDPKGLVIDNLEVNKDWVEACGVHCNEVIFAWGNFKVAETRVEEMVKMFPDAKALVLNKNGSPKHPLYVPSSIAPVKFRT